MPRRSARAPTGTGTTPSAVRRDLAAFTNELYEALSATPHFAAGDRSAFAAGALQTIVRRGLKRRMAPTGKRKAGSRDSPARPTREALLAEELLGRVDDIVEALRERLDAYMPKARRFNLLHPESAQDCAAAPPAAASLCAHNPDALNDDSAAGFLGCTEPAQLALVLHSALRGSGDAERAKDALLWWTLSPETGDHPLGDNAQSPFLHAELGDATPSAGDLLVRCLALAEAPIDQAKVVLGASHTHFLDYLYLARPDGLAVETLLTPAPMEDPVDYAKTMMLLHDHPYDLSRLLVPIPVPSLLSSLQQHSTLAVHGLPLDAKRDALHQVVVLQRSLRQQAAAAAAKDDDASLFFVDQGAPAAAAPAAAPELDPETGEITNDIHGLIQRLDDDQLGDVVGE